LVDSVAFILQAAIGMHSEAE